VICHCGAGGFRGFRPRLVYYGHLVLMGLPVVLVAYKMQCSLLWLKLWGVKSPSWICMKAGHLQLCP
jgi:hypothetical protein